jgi:hypothetical protein
MVYKAVVGYKESAGRVMQFSVPWFRSPLWQRGVRGDLPEAAVPKSPQPPFHKGG